MASFSGFLRALGRMLGRTGTGTGTGTSASTAPKPGSAGTRLPTTGSGRGQSGPNATTQLDARSLRGVTLGYAPRADRRPDPGEVVWTWVPYEENDGRGKDRPVLIVSRIGQAACLGVALTSKSHDGDRGAVALGPGAWDQSGRASWARIDRLFEVHDGGMRREGSALDARRYNLVATALTARYRW